MHKSDLQGHHQRWRSSYPWVVLVQRALADLIGKTPRHVRACGKWQCLPRLAHDDRLFDKAQDRSSLEYMGKVALLLLAAPLPSSILAQLILDSPECQYALDNQFDKAAGNRHCGRRATFLDWFDECGIAHPSSSSLPCPVLQQYYTQVGVDLCPQCEQDTCDRLRSALAFHHYTNLGCRESRYQSQHSGLSAPHRLALPCHQW